MIHHFYLRNTHLDQYYFRQLLYLLSSSVSVFIFGEAVSDAAPRNAHLLEH